VGALLDEARRRPPNIPPLPETFQHYRRELGAQVYGAKGISIEDKKGHDAAVLRNWEFFRAPLAGIVCMHRDQTSEQTVPVRAWRFRSHPPARVSRSGRMATCRSS